MKRFVLDTNVYISALVFGGRPLEPLILAESGFCQLLVSPEILSELQHRLLGKFDWSVEITKHAIERIISLSTLIHPQISIQASPDPDDDKIIECAVQGQAHYIVSGDKHLLSLKEFQKIRIVTVKDFLSIF